VCAQQWNLTDGLRVASSGMQSILNSLIRRLALESATHLFCFLLMTSKNSGLSSIALVEKRPLAVFKLDPQGNFTVLHEFQSGADGANPWEGLTMDEGGNLYGIQNYF
jgi:hypothetical protein